jgi:CBS domain-containing membrane protein
MSRNVVTVSIDASFDEAKRLMLSHDIRHLPVIDNAGKLIGLFSLRAFFDEVLGLKTPVPSA